MPKPNIDITDAQYTIVKNILQKTLSPTDTVWVFGSRATFTTKRASDLDIAIQAKSPISTTTMATLAEDFDQSLLPFKVDIIDLTTTSPEFKTTIKPTLIKFT